MDRCPRCGADVSLTAARCPSCGLARVTAPVGSSADTARPATGSRGRTVMIGAALVVLAVVLATVGLWATGKAPFASPRQPRTPPVSPPPVTITVTPSPTPAEPSRPRRPATLAQVYAHVQSGVGLIQVTTCDGAVSGSGFLIDPTTMVTAEHVVAGAVAVQVRLGGDVESAAVVGIDPADDLALLALPSQSGHAFELAAKDPGPGTPIAAIGFPLGGPKSLTQGTISGRDRTITTESGTFRGLLQTDTAINPGSSGGPLIDATGKVIGVADAITVDAQGIGYAVSSSRVASALASRQTLQPPATPPCAQQPTTRTVVTLTLQSYLDAINAGDYTGAMSLIGPGLRTSRDKWLHDYATTYDTGLNIESVTVSGAVAHAWATFQSHQSAGSGPSGAPNATCLTWSIDYVLSRVDGRWIITQAQGHSTPAYRVC